MKKLKITKLIAGTLVVGLVLVLNPIGASAEWKLADVTKQKDDTYSGGITIHLPVTTTTETY